MANSVLMVVKTATRRYAVRRDDLLDVKMARIGADLQIDGLADRPYLGFQLGKLLDPSDGSALARCRALIVPLRRRYIALLVDNVETFLEHAEVFPLPELLRQRLYQPWATGALIVEDDLMIQLDLRAVARSALLAHSGTSS
jgi:hypothetical protein